MSSYSLTNDNENSQANDISLHLSVTSSKTKFV